MSRWPPDAGARLKACAVRLFAERGFADVTAAEIAAAAGMSERTFFRHFKAKEDVLFEDYSGVRDALTQVVAEAREGASVRELMQLVADGLGERFETSREEQRAFAEIVAREPLLRARSLLRDHEWSEAIAEGFRLRRFSPARATLLARIAAATFRTVYDDWLRSRSAKTLAKRFAAALAELTEELG